MKMSVIGCGYLGAVHAACMARLGHDVIGVDVDAQRVASLNAGRPPFYEPGFPELLKESIASGRLRFVQAPAAQAIADCDVHFITVGTPQSADGTAADMTYVNAAVDSVIEALGDNPRTASGNRPLVVGKSTVPVGTAAALYERVKPAGALLLWNPEFLREGHAVDDTLRPDRIVYGLPPEHGEQAQKVLDGVYADLLAADIPQVITDFSTAELVKVAANSFLATKISFINAMAELCEATGGDVTQLAEAIGHDDRIGKKFLGAGIGFGGGCLPKDIRAFAARAEELGVGDAVGFLKEVDSINTRRMCRVVAACEDALGELSNKPIAVLGGAFKANSDDIRESPALIIATMLAERGADVRLYDPQANENIGRRFPDLGLAGGTEDALRGAQMTLVLTEWQEFKDLDPAAAGQLVAAKRILDGRNILEPQVWKDAGWEYVGMGRR